MLEKFFKKGGDYFYFVFRVFTGLLFFQHGLQKLFGLLGGHAGAVPLVSLLGLAGIIEFAGGLAIAFGIFTRLAAVIAAVEMIVAYILVHAPNGTVPVVNEGELALLYFAAFLALMIYGGRKLSLEKAFWKKELF
jgi:putative oxidoreductase